MTVHAVGILRCLPHILDHGEVIESLSIGAGNSKSRKFDLITNHRIAEFKFIAWKGADTMRQYGLFKDFLNLLLDTSTKKRFLYVLGDVPNKYLTGGMVLSRLWNRHGSLREPFVSSFGEH